MSLIDIGPGVGLEGTGQARVVEMSYRCALCLNDLT